MAYFSSWTARGIRRGKRYDSSMAPLDRHIKIFICRLGQVEFGETPKAGCIVCASVDSEAAAWGILNEVGWHDDGKHFVTISSPQPTKEELERISAEMEAVYQKMPNEKGEILPG
jgi:hypothetical protein